MEGGAVWIEYELDPTPANYSLSYLDSYNSHPEISLFSRHVDPGHPWWDESTGHEYGTFLFMDYLQEHVAGGYGYSTDRDIVRAIWEQVGQGRSPIEAATYVLVSPPGGGAPYGSDAEAWQSVFADFAQRDYLRDFADAGLWRIGDYVLVIERRPALGIPDTFTRSASPSSDPGADFIEILPDNLGLPGGADQTGATLVVTVETVCPYCAVQLITFDSTGGSTVSNPNLTSVNVENRFPYSITNFGAAGATDVQKATLIFSIGVMGAGSQWGLPLPGGTQPFDGYHYTITTTDNPPKTPTGLSASNTGGGYPIQLAWNAVQENGITYNVYQSTTSPVPLDLAYRIVDGLTAPNYTITNGSGGTFYFVVTAVDQGGNESAASAEASTTITPPTPTSTSTPTLTPTPTQTPTSTPTPTPAPTLAPTEVSVQVSQSSDDAGLLPECVYRTNDDNIYFGECHDGSAIVSGFRFANLSIPRGAPILSAYIQFAVDGRYDNPLTLALYGEATGNAQPFSDSSQPADRPLTNASVTWNIPDSNVWNLGETHNSPDLTNIVQEIVNRGDWVSGNALAVVVSNAAPAGGTHRRVIGYERSPADAARLVIVYGGVAPSPTPTSTSTPKFTPTPISPPSTPSGTPPTATPPQPTPTCGCIFGCNPLGSLTSPSKLAALAQSAVDRLRQASDLSSLLYRLRDEVMSQTVEGQRYITVYYTHSAEIATLLLADPVLYDQGFAVLDSFVPGIQAMLDGQGDTVTITAEQMDQALVFLDSLAAVGSLELQQAIAGELSRRPLEDLAGITINQAWSYFNGYTLTWLPPLSTANPYPIRAGRTIPVKFSLANLQGEFVEDDSVTLRLLDGNGNTVIGPVGLADNPTDGIAIDGKQYHYDLRTTGLAPGTYILEVFYNSISPGQTATWTIRITIR